MNPRQRRPQYQQSNASKSSTKRPKSRALNMQFVVLVIGIILTTRLFYLQVIKHGHYNVLAISEHQKKFTIPAERGTLYFRDGEQIVPAVLNAHVYTLYGDPKEVTDPKGVATKLAGILQLDRAKT